MAIRIETRDPGVAGIKESVDRYKRMFPDYKDAIGFYGAIMEVQQQAVSEIECAADLSGIDIEKSIREGSPLLHPADLAVSTPELRGVVSSICAVFESKEAPGFDSCRKLLEWDGLGEEGFIETRDRLLGGESLHLDHAGEGVIDAGLVAGVIWESLVPFYRRCARELQDGIDHSLWQKGNCPICGTGPLMGEFRREDGLWLLECRLCHTLWNVRRATCPFCSESTEGSLEYIYLEDHSSFRAYYCSQCKRYIKNVDLRSAQRDAVLSLENIITELEGLDRAAELEGLIRA
jgi:FdhE protein